LIVRYLAQHDEVPVTQLGTKLRMSQPLISWHLRMLRRARIVKTRREGRLVLCSLDRRSLRTYEERLDRILGIEVEKCADEASDKTLSYEPAGQST
ncbi:MAG TPA: metalloregulator ArsR/SmtB family transcription factor, partial [Chloroflexota bacterium]